MFSNNNRFFIIVENKYNLLKPVLSRFCEIYIPEPEHNGRIINLYHYNINKLFDTDKNKIKQYQRLKTNIIQKMNSIDSVEDLIHYCNYLYDKGITGNDLLNIIDKDYLSSFINQEKKYELLVEFTKVKKEFRNEKILLLFILNFVFLSLDVSIENISFM